MPTGTNLTYVSAAGSGHYPIPRAGDGYRTAHTPQPAKPTGLDWDALTPTGDTRPVRCRWCRHISDQLDDDQLCPDCHEVAVQAPVSGSGPSGEVAKQEAAPELTAAERATVDRIEAAPDALLDDEPDDGCQVVDVDGEPVRVHGNLTTPEDHAAFAEIVRAAKRRYAAEQEPGPVEYAAQLLEATAGHTEPAVQVLRSSILGALAALDLLANPPAPVAAPTPQASSDPPRSSDQPDAATGHNFQTFQKPRARRTPRPPRQGTFPLGKAKQLYADGLSCPQIAREIGSSATYVRSKLKEAGVQMRDDRTRNSGRHGKRRPDQDDPALVARFRDLYLDQGLTIAAAAAKAGIGVKAASNLMTRHNIPARPPASQAGQPPRWQKITDTQATEIADRYTAGESTVALAEAYGVSSNSIGNILDRLGVARRTASQARQLALANGAARIDGASIVAAQLRELGVTAHQVKAWAYGQGFIERITTGVPPLHLVDAYQAAHPTNTSKEHHQ